MLETLNTNSKRKIETGGLSKTKWSRSNTCNTYGSAHASANQFISKERDQKRAIHNLTTHTVALTHSPLLILTTHNYSQARHSHLSTCTLPLLILKSAVLEVTPTGSVNNTFLSSQQLQHPYEIDSVTVKSEVVHSSKISRLHVKKPQRRPPTAHTTNLWLADFTTAT
jgi:hypothetical protein